MGALSLLVLASSGTTVLRIIALNSRFAGRSYKNIRNEPQFCASAIVARDTDRKSNCAIFII